jgi:hypothetical protein
VVQITEAISIEPLLTMVNDQAPLEPVEESSASKDATKTFDQQACRQQDSCLSFKPEVTPLSQRE